MVTWRDIALKEVAINIKNADNLVEEQETKHTRMNLQQAHKCLWEEVSSNELPRLSRPIKKNNNPGRKEA